MTLPVPSDLQYTLIKCIAHVKAEVDYRSISICVCN